MRVASISVLGIGVAGLLGALLLRAMKSAKDGSGDPNERHRPRPPGRDDPRWGPGDGSVQIAGKACGACGSRITVAFEGAACDICREPFHTKCITRHVAASHKPEEGTPYR